MDVDEALNEVLYPVWRRHENNLPWQEESWFNVETEEQPPVENIGGVVIHLIAPIVPRVNIVTSDAASALQTLIMTDITKRLGYFLSQRIRALEEATPAAHAHDPNLCRNLAMADPLLYTTFAAQDFNDFDDTRLIAFNRCRTSRDLIPTLFFIVGSLFLVSGVNDRTIVPSICVKLSHYSGPRALSVLSAISGVQSMNVPSIDNAVCFFTDTRLDESSVLSSLSSDPLPLSFERPSPPEQLITKNEYYLHPLSSLRHLPVYDGGPDSKLAHPKELCDRERVDLANYRKLDYLYEELERDDVVIVLFTAGTKASSAKIAQQGIARSVHFSIQALIRLTHDKSAREDSYEETLSAYSPEPFGIAPPSF